MDMWFNTFEHPKLDIPTRLMCSVKRLRKKMQRVGETRLWLLKCNVVPRVKPNFFPTDTRGDGKNNHTVYNMHMVVHTGTYIYIYLDIILYYFIIIKRHNDNTHLKVAAFSPYYATTTTTTTMRWRRRSRRRRRRRRRLGSGGGKDEVVVPRVGGKPVSLVGSDAATT